MLIRLSQKIENHTKNLKKAILILECNTSSDKQQK
jgi:hypothetical protein